MKLFRKMTFGLLIFAATLILISYLLPTVWKVERSVVINAPSEKIFPYIANLKIGWPQWSAFDFEDPDIQYTYSGPDTGRGATRSWVSKRVGDGLQTITRADANAGIEFELEMRNGFELQGQIVLTPIQNGTKVTWIDTGDVKNKPLFRWMGIMMDSIMGPSFEKSLAVLKNRVETK